MDLLIKIDNISQIRSIAESLPEDILKQAVVNGKPVLNYLRNTPVFSGKNGMFSVECLNREFISNRINAGVLLDSNERVLAYLDQAKINANFEIWHKESKLAVFTTYYGVQIFLGNLCTESLGDIDVYFLTGRIAGDVLMKSKPRWFIQYKNENNHLETQMFMSKPLDEIISDFNGMENMNIWDLNTNIFMGSFNKGIQKYWTNTLDC